MQKNVYNLVWADDEIDDLLGSYTEDLGCKGFIVFGAHDGQELEAILDSKKNIIDAVIVDANFSESDTNVYSERNTSGLDYARNLYIMKLNRSVPFFLFTNRSDELIKEIYQHNPKFLEDFPRYIRWFNKSGQGEFKMMFDKIKETIDRNGSTSFIIRNRYQYELNAASLIDETYEFLFDFLCREHTNTLEGMVEPFIKVRLSVEKIYGYCENIGLIPPISKDTNGTTKYLLYGTYKEKDSSGHEYERYKMLDKSLISKPLAYSLKYMVDIVQDAAHSKIGLKLNVHAYWEQTKDILLLRSVVYILIDFIKWFALKASKHQDKDENMKSLWTDLSKVSANQ